jgi:hypothetical protein
LEFISTELQTALEIIWIRRRGRIIYCYLPWGYNFFSLPTYKQRKTSES